MNPRIAFTLALLALTACTKNNGAAHPSPGVIEPRGNQPPTPAPAIPAPENPLASPFEIALVGKTKFAAGHDGFAPALPGFHLVADIGAINLTPRKAGAGAENVRVADTLVLRIATSPGMPPMLEGFTLASERGSLQTFLSKEGPPADTEVRGKDGKTQIVSSPRYVEMKVVDKTVEVRLLPPAMEWLKNGGTIQWVDWYR